ncbi:MAG: lipopolysaccharide biosynthesis protein [Candidatus Kapaibacteriota bacterium]
MKLSDNIDKVVWSLLDKGLYVLYGFVVILQIRRIEPAELGLFSILIALHTWIFVIADSLFLQSIIQFGFDPKTEKQANTFSFVFLVMFVGALTVAFSLLSNLWINLFNEAGLGKVATFLPWLSLLTIPRMYFLKFAYKHSDMLRVFVIDSAFFLTMSSITIYLFFTQPIFTFHTLIKIYFSGTIFSSIVAVIIAKRYVKLGFNGELKLKNYLNFGVPMMLLSLFQSIPRQLDVLFLQYFFQSKIVGIYYSAKTLFRLFEEALNAGYSLVYPTAVRLIAKNRKDELESLIIKSTSFTFLGLFSLFIILEFGGSSLFIKFLLPSKYLLSVDFFNIMLISTLFMSLQLYASIMIAEKKLKLVVIYIFISALLSVSVFVGIGVMGLASLMPLGLVSYYFSLGTLVYLQLRKEHNLKLFYLFQGARDFFNFVQNKFRSKRSNP